MWFLGMLAGLVVGGIIGHGGGAVAGAILGALAGIVYRANNPTQPGEDSAYTHRLAELERKIDHIYKSLEDIHWRLTKLEKGEAQEPVREAPDSQEPVAAPAAPPVAAASEQRSKLTIEEAIAVDALGVAPLEAATASDSGKQQDSTPASDQQGAAPIETGLSEPEPDRKWLVGLAIGAVFGLMMGGFTFAVIGAFFGAVVGTVISTFMSMQGVSELQEDDKPAATGETRVETAGTDVASAGTPAADTDARMPDVATTTEPAAAAPSFFDVAKDVRTSVAETVVTRELPPAEVAAPQPESPPESRTPEWLQRLLSGNIVAKVGAVILFFGVGFLLKFAYDHTVVPIPVRLMGVAVAGLAMVYGGWRLCSSRRLYGLILQGAGIGVLYVDVFFALKIFALIHPVAAFALFMLLGVAATLLAVRQDSRVLAVLGLTGAFLAPVIASRGGGQHVLLFSYYTLLNGFILAISWFKSWRELNLTGFIFTFIVGVAWGANNYRPELFGSVEPFVLIFFAMYLVIPILFAARQPPNLRGLVDGTLVFGTPLSVAFMQASLVRDLPNGLAWSAGCGAGLYAVLAFFVIRREGMRLLGETYIALSVVLATLAIFFALDAYPTFALWSLEGAAIIWVGLRQQRILARAFGLFVQLAGAAYFALHYNDYMLANPWFNDFTLGCAIIFLASTITVWQTHKYRAVLSEFEPAIAFVLLMWGCAWWLAGWLHAFHYGVSADYFSSAALALFGVSALVAEWAGSRLSWTDLRKMTCAHIVLMAAVALHWFMRALSPDAAATHPLAQAGYAAWPFNFAVLFWCLHCQMRDGLTTTSSPRYYGGWALMGLLATWMALWLQLHEKFGWAMAWGALGMGVGWLRYRLREDGQAAAWPLSVAALAWGMTFWMVAGLSSIHDNVAYPLRVACGLGFTTVSVVLFEIFGAFLRWPALRHAQLLLLPAMVGAFGLQFERQSHPFADYGWAAWGAAFAALFLLIARQAAVNVLLAGSLQQVVALAMLVAVLSWEASWLIAHQHYELSWLMGVIVMAAAYWRFHHFERTAPEAVPYSTGALMWGLAVWLISGWLYVGERLPHEMEAIGGFAYVAVSVALFEAIGSWRQWTALRRAQLILPFVMVYTAAFQVLHHSHPFADYGWVVWPAAFAVFYVVLVRHDRDGVAVAANAQRVFVAALLIALMTWEAGWLLTHHHFELAAALGFAAIGGAYLRFHLRERDDAQAPRLSSWALGWGLVVWIAAGLGYVDDSIAPALHVACGLGWVVVTCVLAEAAGSLLRWNALRSVESMLPLLMAVAAALQILRDPHPAAGNAGFAWVAAFVALYGVLYRQQRDAIASEARLQHLFAIWLATGLGAWECAWQLAQFAPATSWAFAMWGLVPAVVLFAIARYGSVTWPWRDEFGIFRNAGLGPLTLYSVAWSLASNASPAMTAPLPYIPLLNPVDVVQAASLYALYTWLRAAGAVDAEREKQYPLVLAALAFIWINSIVLRSIHHWLDVPYVAHELFNSIVAQAAFSLLWTLTAMVMMVIGTRRLQRPPWFTGAALLAVVVGKLFLLDLANSGTVERIVSFLGVGVLLMVIGYVAPVPPGNTERQTG